MHLSIYGVFMLYGRNCLLSTLALIWKSIKALGWDLQDKMTGSNYQWLKEKRRKEFEFSDPIHLWTIWDFKCCFVWTNPFFYCAHDESIFAVNNHQKLEKAVRGLLLVSKLHELICINRVCWREKFSLFCACPFVGCCYVATTKRVLCYNFAVPNFDTFL